MLSPEDWEAIRQRWERGDVRKTDVQVLLADAAVMRFFRARVAGIVATANRMIIDAGRLSEGEPVYAARCGILEGAMASLETLVRQTGGDDDMETANAQALLDLLRRRTAGQ